MEVIIVLALVYLTGYATSKLLNHKPEGGHIGYVVVGITVLVMCLMILLILKKLI